jgi:beta-N-acetylhexosaminidase
MKNREEALDKKNYPANKKRAEGPTAPRVKGKISRLRIIVSSLTLLVVAGTIGFFLLYQETQEPEPINPYRGGVVIGSSERALEIMADMTVEEKVGQMFMTPYRGDGSDMSALTDYHIGGFIYTGVFFENNTPESASITFREMNEFQEMKPFQGVAEEGGDITAVSKWPAFRPTPYRLPRELYDDGGLDAVLTQEEEKLLFLKRMGLNLNFGPITNIATKPSDSLYQQTIGQDAEKTSEYIRRLTLLYDELGMSAVLRYYTGEDTEAFMTGCYMGAPAVMMSNRVITSGDSVDSSRPMSLSKPWHDYLRDELGFEGVIILSDVASGVFNEYAGEQVKSVMAIEAGNDMIWATYYEEEIEGVLAAIENGTLSIQDVDDSVVRVLTWKLRYGLIE